MPGNDAEQLIVVHPLHKLVAAFRCLHYPGYGAQFVDYMRLPEDMITEATAQLVAYVLRTYVRDGDGDGNNHVDHGEGDYAGRGAAAISPDLGLGACPARSTFVRKLLAWTEVVDPAGHRKLKAALAAHGRARRAGLLPPDL